MESDISYCVQLWPRIQKALDDFKEAWINHRLFTEHGRTPHQLFIPGILQQASRRQRGIDKLIFESPILEPLEEEQVHYGVEIDDLDRERYFQRGTNYSRIHLNHSSLRN